MSDLRNSDGFNSVSAEEIRVTETGFGEKHSIIDNGGLSSFHHFEEEEEGSGKAKMIGGGLVVALLLGAAGLYAFTGTGSAPMKAPASQLASNAPVQTAPAPVTPPAAMPAPAPDVAANMPAASGTTAKSPYDAAPVAKAPNDTASVAPDTKSDLAKSDVSKPVKTASKSKNDAAMNQAESEQTAQLNSAAAIATKNGSMPMPATSPATSDVAGNAPAAAPSSDVAAANPAPVDANGTPLPTPPAPPASSVASNGQSVGTQSAEDIPAVTPEQQAAPATPAPQPEQAAQPQAQPVPAQPQ